MRALRADSENVAADLNEEDFFIADMSEQLAVGESGENDALAEIRASRLRLLCVHEVLSLTRFGDLSPRAYLCIGEVAAEGGAFKI
jgi:hypothetical protein